MMVKIPIKYVNQPCEYCKRLRVEKYDNGDLICEKCGWNKTKKEFENLHELREMIFLSEFEQEEAE